MAAAPTAEMVCRLQEYVKQQETDAINVKKGFLIGDVLASCGAGNLSSSIWAPGNEKLLREAHAPRVAKVNTFVPSEKWSRNSSILASGNEKQLPEARNSLPKKLDTHRIERNSDVTEWSGCIGMKGSSRPPPFPTKLDSKIGPVRHTMTIPPTSQPKICGDRCSGTSTIPNIESFNVTPLLSGDVSNASSQSKMKSDNSASQVARLQDGVPAGPDELKMRQEEFKKRYAWKGKPQPPRPGSTQGATTSRAPPDDLQPKSRVDFGVLLDGHTRANYHQIPMPSPPPTSTPLPDPLTIGSLQYIQADSQLNEDTLHSTNKSTLAYPGSSTMQPPQLNEVIVSQLKKKHDIRINGVALTEDALFRSTGYKTHEISNDFEDRISDTGVGEQPREIVRATQGTPAAKELLDWQNQWQPPPCDWENDRGVFDTSFISDYIMEWQLHVPSGLSVKVDMNDDFRRGKHPVLNDRLDEPIEQPDCIPDIKYSEDENKRLFQTSAIEANNYSAMIEKKERSKARSKAAGDARCKKITLQKPEPNPFSPTIKIYLRPANETDSDAIARIYNRHIETSTSPEDQKKIDVSQAKFLITNNKAERLPFIVAVKTPISARLGPDEVIGFAFAEHFNYGFTGTSKGRSRATVCLQVYVHPQNTRNGVGRNLIDRLVHTLSDAYGYRNACDWVNPEGDKINEPGGSGLWHQMIFQIAVQRKDDPTFPWVSRFLLSRFFFKEEARLKSVARSSVDQGNAIFLDLAILQFEARHADEFDCYV